MNAWHATGWLPEDAGWGYRDAEHAVLMFDLVVVDSRGERHALKCRIEDAETARRYESLLTRGRALVVTGEPIRVAVERHGYTRHETTSFRVLAIEVPDRTRPAQAASVSESLAKEAAA